MMALCVLRSGGLYTPDHVQRLAAQLPGLGLWCLSDVPVPRVPTLRLNHDWPGWWAKLELFRPDLLFGDYLYLDLDTEITGDLERLIRIGRASDCSLLWDDPLQPEHANSSVMWLRHADRAAVWAAFHRDPQGAMAQYRHWPDRWGDQGFIAAHLPNFGRWPAGLIRSWRVECQQGIPAGTVVVAFHGKPKPWDLARERRVVGEATP